MKNDSINSWSMFSDEDTTGYGFNDIEKVFENNENKLENYLSNFL